MKVAGCRTTLYH